MPDMLKSALLFTAVAAKIRETLITMKLGFISPTFSYKIGIRESSINKHPRRGEEITGINFCRTQSHQFKEQCRKTHQNLICYRHNLLKFNALHFGDFNFGNYCQNRRHSFTEIQFLAAYKYLNHLSELWTFTILPSREGLSKLSVHYAKTDDVGYRRSWLVKIFCTAHFVHTIGCQFVH